MAKNTPPAVIEAGALQVSKMRPKVYGDPKTLTLEPGPNYVALLESLDAPDRSLPSLSTSNVIDITPGGAP